MLEIGLGHYLSVAAILFALGIFGIFINRKNVIVILMSIELMLLSVNLNLVAFSTHLNDLVGQVVFFRNRGSIAVEDINMMKG
jgi:NADH-quinone oxidoreductase subunit K